MLLTCFRRTNRRAVGIRAHTLRLQHDFLRLVQSRANQTEDCLSPWSPRRPAVTNIAGTMMRNARSSVETSGSVTTHSTAPFAFHNFRFRGVRASNSLSNGICLCPVTFRNSFCATSNPDPAQRSRWSPLCQRFTFLQTCSTIENARLDDIGVGQRLAQLHRNMEPVDRQCLLHPFAQAPGRVRSIST